jgi:hypothetical protein
MAELCQEDPRTCIRFNGYLHEPHTFRSTRFNSTIESLIARPINNGAVAKSLTSLRLGPNGIGDVGMVVLGQALIQTSSWTTFNAVVNTLRRTET